MSSRKFRMNPNICYIYRDFANPLNAINAPCNIIPTKKEYIVLLYNQFKLV
jgi:hypothetical protein